MTSTAANYNPYDPAPWYLKYNNDPTSTYYTYYIFNKFFDDMGMPLPNLEEYVNHMQYF